MEINSNLLSRLNQRIDYSVRRYFVDEFFLRNIEIFNEDSRIIDIGGKKIRKRGVFNIENYSFKVEYVNLSPETQPDFLCDAALIPVGDNVYDGIIISEVLEHVPDPKLILTEAFRVMKPGAKALICTPFLFFVHADPFDYGRYTDYYFITALKEIGFKNIRIEKQGLFFSVLSNMLRLWVNELDKTGRLKSTIKTILLLKFIKWFTKKALTWDKEQFVLDNPILSGHTTGFGVVCQK